MKHDSELLPSMIIGFIDEEDVCVLNIEYPKIRFCSEREITSTFSMKLAVFNAENYDYIEFYFDNCILVKTEPYEFSITYEALLGFINIKDESIFLKKLNEALKISNNLEKIKAGCYDGVEFLKDYQPVYPFNRNNQFPEGYEQAKTGLMKLLQMPEDFSAYDKLSKKYVLAFSADSYPIYHQMLKMSISDVIKHTLEHDHLNNHPIFAVNFTHLSIGSEFCANLVPPVEMMEELIDKSTREGFGVTVAYPILRESRLKELHQLLSMLDAYSNKNKLPIEITINDWGVLQCLHEYSNPLIKPIAGRLLNKRQKDSRDIWKWKVKNYDLHMQSNMLNEPIVREFLAKNGITRYEYESHNHPNKIDGGAHSLFFPYYQICTSVYCHMFMTCANQKGSNLHSIDQCPHLCEDMVYLYLEHLSALGKGNTIYGFDCKLLSDVNYLKNCLDSGIDRLVYTSV